MTLRYVYGQDVTVARLVASLIPHVGYRGFPANRTIGIVNGSRLVAGLVYTNYNSMAGTIEISGAALPGAYWFSRETIQRMFDFAFEQNACQLVAMRVMADNETLLAQLASFGLAFVKVDRMYGRDMDGVIATFTDDQWANHRYNKNAPRPLKQEAA